ncbi:hypothetical protein AB0G54_10795 [Streptomyces yokosukanensis]|uniref:hypothetical protein n=1 Tax=Streptomyces yokosukanensis TaxID=67386 RepID=UPI003421B5B4
MSDHQTLAPGQFVNDRVAVDSVSPPSVIAGVPAAKSAAERYGHEMRLDRLDVRVVQWMHCGMYDTSREFFAETAGRLNPLQVRAS